MVGGIMVGLFYPIVVVVDGPIVGVVAFVGGVDTLVRRHMGDMELVGCKDGALVPFAVVVHGNLVVESAIVDDAS
jgi:hypothetical protein